MKRIIALILSVVLSVTTAFTTSAAVAVPSDYDPFGTSAFGPNAPVVSGTYKQITQLRSYKMGVRVFEIYVTVNSKSVPLYISFPNFGGFRFYGRETGDFEPESLSKINYAYDPNGSIVMSGTDGTTVIFTAYSSSFLIKIYDGNGNYILDFASSQLKFGYNGSTICSVFLQMPLEPDEIIYGTGERFSGLNQNGRRTFMWNVDCGYHGNSENAELWRGYKNVPIIHSDRGYTLFYNSYCSAEVDIGYTNPNAYFFKFAGSELDFYLWTGTSLDNIEKYTDLTGKSILPPKWAFRYLAGGGNGYWYGNNWGENNNPEEYLALLQDVIDNFESIGTPDIAAIYCEGYMAENDDAYDLLDSYGIRMLKWNSPDLEREEMEKYLPDVASEDFPIIKRIATDSDSGCFIDFTHKNAARLMLNWLKSYAEKGIRGGLLDFGELIQQNTVFSDNTTGKTMHNKFSVLYAKGYNDAMNTLVGNDYIFMSRAASAGSQSYTCCFSGDQAATFYGLRQQLSAGLSLSTSGFSIWGGDLSGYEGTPTNEVFCRGTQLSAFYPLMRAHGTRSRMPWDYGEEGIKNHQIYYWLRENLLDTVYSSAVDSSVTGLPMMRAFALQFPEQQELAAIDDSYIFCEDFLVAPILESGAISREITFPEGNWYSIWDGSRITGSTTRTVAAPITVIPAFLRSGATVPVNLSADYQLAVSMANGNRVKALLVTPAEGKHSKVFYPDKETQVDYSNRVIDGGYRITATTGNETTAVKALDTQALAVVADGQALSKLAVLPSENEVGYYVTNDGMTVISLGTSDWKQIDIIVEDESLCIKSWNFSSENELSDFNTYINDMRITNGHAELHSAEECFTWRDDGTVKATGVFYNESGSPLYWAGLSQASVSMSPKDVNIRNFETEVNFIINSGGGSNGAVMVGFRETIPGAHKPEGLDSWSFGLQNSSNKIYSAIVSAVGENKIWVYNAGNSTVNTTVAGAQFISDKSYYKMNLRVVENTGAVTVYSPNGEQLYTAEFNVYENLAQSGAISFYANGPCIIDSIKLINLDENGNPKDFENYKDEYIEEKLTQSILEWNTPLNFKIATEGETLIYRYDENAYDSFTLSAVKTDNNPLYIGLSSSGTALPDLNTEGIICCIDGEDLTVKNYSGSVEKTIAYTIRSASRNSISLNLESGKLTLNVDGTSYLLNTSYINGCPFIKTSEGTACGIGFLYENIFDTEFGYVSNVATAEKTETVRENQFWSISSDGIYTRCNVDAGGESAGDEWYNNSNHIADMAFVYYPKINTADSLLSYKVKAGTTRWGRIYVGIGGEAGKSWRNIGGGAVFYIDGSGNLLASGFINSETSYTEGKTVGVIEDFDMNKTYALSIRQQNGYITVFANGEQIGRIADCEWLQKGCVYFASNSSEAMVSDIEVAHTVPFGDVNYDFIVEQSDFEAIRSALLADTATDIMDIDRNGKVNICDAVLAYNTVNNIIQPPSAETVTLSLKAESTVQNNLQSLKLNVNTDTALGGIAAEISIEPSVLSFGSVELGGAVNDGNVTENSVSLNTVAARLCLIDTDAGKLAELPLNILTNDYVVTQITLSPLSVAGSGGSEIQCDADTCTVEINRHILGDANDDMKVDLKDIVRLKKYLSNFDTKINSTKSDCNFDSSIDAGDLILIKKLLIGVIDSI